MAKGRDMTVISGPRMMDGTGVVAVTQWNGVYTESAESAKEE